MAKVVLDVKEEVKATIEKYAKKNKKTIKEVILEAVSLLMLEDLSLLLKEFKKSSFQKEKKV